MAAVRGRNPAQYDAYALIDSILNFSKNCPPEMVARYLDLIVPKLLFLLRNGKRNVQEGALTALASVIDSSQGQFQKYYDAVMPDLKRIFVNATGVWKKILKGKSMDCISLVGMAVGKDKFRDDAKQVMDKCMSFQGCPCLNDDSLMHYLLQAWKRIYKCLGQDFHPYTDIMIPALIRTFEPRHRDFITSADSDDDSLETMTFGDQKIGIRANVIKETATSCNLLCCYAHEFPEQFFPWIYPVVHRLIPLLTFYYHEEVKRAAVAAMPKLLSSAKKVVVKKQAQGCPKDYLKHLFDYIIPALVEALHEERGIAMVAAKLESLNECMQLSGVIIGENQVRSIVDEIKNVNAASEMRRTHRLERAKTEDFDTDEGELLQDEAIFHQVGKCLGTLIKIFKNSFLPFFDELSVYITPMLRKDKTREERRIAICIYNDVAEQCHEAAHKYYETFLPFLLEASNDEDANVRQAAVYGIGVCAEYGVAVFRPLVGEALSKLNNVIRHADALNSENLMAYDNSVSALGKICQYHRESIDAAQVFPAWLKCLPLKGDLIEAKVAHDRLCSMVERSDPELLGPDNQYLPKIISVFAEVLCGKDLASEQTLSRIISLSRRMREKLPPAVLAMLWNSLSKQQRALLQFLLC